MEFSGITEILGCKGTGKTTYILNMLKDTKVAYFTTKKLPITLLENIYVQKEIPLTNLHINVVFDIYKLKHIYLNTLNSFIVENEVKAVVIDTFDSLFTTVHDADKKNELFALMDVIKEVCFRHEVSTFLIQEFPRKTDPFKSYVIRYDIKYMINKQISLTKNNRIFTIRSEDFVNGVKCTRKFRICNNAIEYVHEASNGDVHLGKPFKTM